MLRLAMPLYYAALITFHFFIAFTLDDTRYWLYADYGFILRYFRYAISFHFADAISFHFLSLWYAAFHALLFFFFFLIRRVLLFLRIHAVYWYLLWLLHFFTPIFTPFSPILFSCFIDIFEPLSLLPRYFQPLLWYFRLLIIDRGVSLLLAAIDLITFVTHRHFARYRITPRGRRSAGGECA